MQPPWCSLLFRPARKGATLLLALFVVACSGSQAPYSTDSYRGQYEGYATSSVESDSANRVQVASTGGMSRRDSNTVRLAQNAAPAAPVPSYGAPISQGPPPPPMAASDAVPAMEAPRSGETHQQDGPLLIYTATLYLAIHHVADHIERAVSMAEESGGWAAQRGADFVVLRVPAMQFRPMLETLSQLGDVLSLDWNAQDVSDEFLDLEIRLRNALEMRTRLEALLARADKIEDLLAIEEQLQRVTLEIEQLQGRLRVLGDRISFSTITLRFQTRPVDNSPTETFRLPFRWLQTLGLPQLLSL